MSLYLTLGDAQYPAKSLLFCIHVVMKCAYCPNHIQVPSVLASHLISFDAIPVVSFGLVWWHNYIAARKCDGILLVSVGIKLFRFQCSPDCCKLPCNCNLLDGGVPIKFSTWADNSENSQKFSLDDRVPKYSPSPSIHGDNFDIPCTFTSSLTPGALIEYAMRLQFPSEPNLLFS